MTAPEQFVQPLPNGTVRDFRMAPDGHEGTPLVAKLQEIMNTYETYDKELLIIVATDGHPSEGNEAMFALMDERNQNKRLRQKYPISFLMCTEEESVVKFYDQLKDKKYYKGIEVTEPYEAERREVIDELHKDRFTGITWLKCF